MGKPLLEPEVELLLRVKEHVDKALEGFIGSKPPVRSLESFFKKTLELKAPKEHRVSFKIDGEAVGVVRPDNFYTAVVLFYAQSGIPISGMGPVGGTDHVVEGVGALRWDTQKQELLFAPLRPSEFLEIEFTIGKEGFSHGRSGEEIG